MPRGIACTLTSLRWHWCLKQLCSTTCIHEKVVSLSSSCSRTPLQHIPMSADVQNPQLVAILGQLHRLPAERRIEYKNVEGFRPEWYIATTVIVEIYHSGWKPSKCACISFKGGFFSFVWFFPLFGLSLIKRDSTLHTHRLVFFFFFFPLFDLSLIQGDSTLHTYTVSCLFPSRISSTII